MGIIFGRWSVVMPVLASDTHRENPGISRKDARNYGNHVHVPGEYLSNDESNITHPMSPPCMYPMVHLQDGVEGKVCERVVKCV